MERGCWGNCCSGFDRQTERGGERERGKLEREKKDERGREIEKREQKKRGARG